MDEKTLTALKGSIAKWERIVKRTGVDNGSENCPLCHIYLPLKCQGCPVGKHCIDTVWGKWTLHHAVVHHKPRRSIVGKCRTCKKLAREELEFLQSLLPKDTK